MTRGAQQDAVLWLEGHRAEGASPAVPDRAMGIIKTVPCAAMNLFFSWYPCREKEKKEENQYFSNTRVRKCIYFRNKLGWHLLCCPFSPVQRRGRSL